MQARYVWSDVIDKDSGMVRVLNEQCKTCIFRPGDIMSLGTRRMHEVVQGNLRASSLLTCHATLPGMPKDDNYQPASCRGFWDLHGMRTTAGIIAEYIIGVTFVSPPEQEDGNDGSAST